MTRSSLGFIMRAAELLNQQTPRLDEHYLKAIVQSFIERKDIFLGTVRKYGSPLYAIDSGALTSRARQFRNAFVREMPRTKFYYALKSNSQPIIASTLLGEGYGIDVSSGRELEQALELGAHDIVFSGPGKTTGELKLAVEHRDVVTVLLDSFGELTRLEEAATGAGGTIRAGVRLTTDVSGIWRKFGIPIESLGRFFRVAESYRHIDLCGLQFHVSWNLNSDAQVVFIADLGAALANLDAKTRRRIKFIDFGGGFWPEAGEWLQPAATPEGMLKAAMSEDPPGHQSHYHRPSSLITDFAGHIGRAFHHHLPDDMEFALYCEPGRWLCNDAMHILLTVVDRKAPDIVITDGGTNAVGWERFETDYFPVINLSRPGLKEHKCLVAGSLCTPHDFWGYGYFGDGIRSGDVLLVPNQGAYTYSLRQQFIKPLPRCVRLVTDRHSPAETQVAEQKKEKQP